MRKKRTLIAALTAVFLFTAAGSLAKLQQVGHKNVDKKKEEPTTLIDLDKITDKQRHHSKLFKHAGRKLLDIAASQPTDVLVEEEAGAPIILTKDAPKVLPFRAALCNADAVIVGTINSKSAQLTEERNFIFTDYDVTVEEIIKNNLTRPIQLNNLITTTRDGGAVKINDRVLRAIREDFDPPQTGERYLMFLRFIPATGAYLMYGNGTFQLNDYSVEALGSASQAQLSRDGSKDTHTFLNELRSFAGIPCN